MGAEMTRPHMTAWEDKVRRHVNAAEEPKPVDPHLERLRAEGFTNGQIAVITGLPKYEVNLLLGPQDLRGRAA